MAERSSPRSVRFDPLAEVEYFDALVYYEKEAGLGAAFEEAVKRGLDLIQKHPEGSPVVTPEGARKRVLGRFSYNLYYTLERDSIYVWAVAHQKRRPGYWYERLQP